MPPGHRPPSDLRRPDDAEARELAITTMGRNMVVVAGAGSGKTSILVERVLYLLLSGAIPPAGLLAITFTEAAAAEMRVRLRDALELVASGAEGNGLAMRTAARFREQGWSDATIVEHARDVASQLDAGSILTIHGYCNALLRRYPVHARVSPGFAVATLHELEQEAEQAWIQILQNETPGDARGDALSDLLDEFDPSDLKQWFSCLLDPAVPVEEWAREGTHNDSAGEWFSAQLAGARERLAALLPGLPNTKFTALVADCKYKLERFEAGGIAAISAMAPVPDGDTKSAKIPADDVEFAKRVRRLLNMIIQINDAAVNLAVGWMIPPVLKIRERLRRRGWMTFDAMLSEARDLLRDHPAVRRSEAGRIQALLVDEFQDTDPLQYDIIFYLCGDSRSVEIRDAAAIPAVPGKLFIVGDPKQSIYRFRGADIAACTRAMDKLVRDGALRIELNTSFRSPSEMLDPLDQLFKDWIPAQNALEAEAHAAPEYCSIVGHRRDGDRRFGPAPRVEVWLANGESASERRREEALWLADSIYNNITENGLRAADHVILLRAFSNVSIYSRALERRGIPFLLQGGRTFYQRTEVNDLISWMRAVAEPADSVALLAAMRSPSGAVPDSELQQFIRAGGAWDVRRLPGGEFPGVDRVFCMLRELRQFARRHPVAAVFRELLQRTRLYELHAAGFDGAQRIANLQKCRQIVLDLADTRGFSLDEIARELSTRSAESDAEGERSLGDSGVDAVTIFTIHGAKGLEFPIVYVADLQRSDQTLRNDTILRPGPGRSICAVARKSKIYSSQGAMRELQQLAHDDAEMRRYLYVAATRASERCIFVLGTATRGAGGEWPSRIRAAFGVDRGSPEGPAHGGRVWVRRQPEKTGDASLATRSTVDCTPAVKRFEAARSAMAAGVRAPLRSPSITKDKMREVNLDEDAPDRGVRIGGRSNGRAVGIAIHTILQKLTFGDTAAAGVANLLDRAVTDAAAACGIAPDAVRSDVADIMKRFLNSGLHKRLAGATVHSRELPMIEPAPGGAIHGFADIVFEERGLWICGDFKTDRITNDNDLREAVDRYAPQVTWYATTLAKAAGRPVRAELLFIRADRAISPGDMAFESEE